jgi:hypothetical protein
MGKPDQTNPSTKPQDDKSRAAPIPSASIRTQVSRARVVIHRKVRVVRKAAVISRSKTPSGRPSAKGAFGRPWLFSGHRPFLGALHSQRCWPWTNIHAKVQMFRSLGAAAAFWPLFLPERFRNGPPPPPLH